MKFVNFSILFAVCLTTSELYADGLPANPWLAGNTEYTESSRQINEQNQEIYQSQPDYAHPVQQPINNINFGGVMQNLQERAESFNQQRQELQDNAERTAGTINTLNNLVSAFNGNNSPNSSEENSGVFSLSNTLSDFSQRRSSDNAVSAQMNEIRNKKDNAVKEYNRYKKQTVSRYNRMKNKVKSWYYSLKKGVQNVEQTAQKSVRDLQKMAK